MEKSVVPPEKTPLLSKKKETKEKKGKLEKRMTVQRELSVDLTEKEILSYSRELAKVNQDLASEEESKKEVMSDFANKITVFKTNISTLARKISNGYEYRTVDVDVFFDYKRGIKSYIRRDTKKVIREEAMTDMDRQQELKLKDKKDKKAAEKKATEEKAEAEKKDKKEKKEDKNKKDKK